MSNNRPVLPNKKRSFFESKMESGDAKMNCRELELSPADIQDLAEFLKSKPNLQELNLNYNNLGKEGIKPLKEIILQNKLLTKISALYNKIGDEGVLSLVSDEEIKPRLAEIYIELACNEITELGLEAARTVLSPESRLSIISGNKIWDAELLEQCRSSAANLLNSKESKEAPSVPATDKETNSSASARTNLFSSKKQKCELPLEVKQLATQLTTQIGSNPEMWEALDQYLQDVKSRQLPLPPQVVK